MDFTPPQIQPKLPEWATYIPNRRPEFKIHKRRGDALNAFHYRTNAILYHFEDDEWKELIRIENHRSKEINDCENCGKSLWKESSYQPQRSYHYGTTKWFHNPLRYLVVCDLCRRIGR